MKLELSQFQQPHLRCGTQLTWSVDPEVAIFVAQYYNGSFACWGSTKVIRTATIKIKLDLTNYNRSKTKQKINNKRGAIGKKLKCVRTSSVSSWSLLRANWLNDIILGPSFKWLQLWLQFIRVGLLEKGLNQRRRLKLAELCVLRWKKTPKIIRHSPVI